VALAAGALMLYNESNNVDSKEIESTVISNELYSYETSYYQQRKDALLKIKNDLLDTKNGLERIVSKGNNSKTSFMHKFLRQLKLDESNFLETTAFYDEAKLEI
jgi:hypothetical protein